MKSLFIICFSFSIFLFVSNCSQKEPITHTVKFSKSLTDKSWSLFELNPELPSDWSSYKYLVLEMRASSPQRFSFGFKTEGGLFTKKIHPFPGSWIRMAVPLDFYRRENTKGSEMASTWNQPRATGWMNIYGGGFGALTGIDTIYVGMEVPIGEPSLEIRSVFLTKDEVSGAVLNHEPLVDKFGQWIPTQWSGKVKTIDELKKIWHKEDLSLKPGGFNYSKYGGYLNTQEKATGFFRVEKIDGKWWFVDPDGHLFLAAGMNGVRNGTYTRTENREGIFSAIPPKEFQREARNDSSSPNVSFSAWNHYRRFGENWKSKWKDMSVRRMDAWGLNAVNWSDKVFNDKKAYAKFLYGWGIEEGIMGMPDVYSQEFYDNANRIAAEQCAPLKDDPWMLGYFMGNEPPWPGRESLMVDAILDGPETEMQSKLKLYLTEDDTPNRRKLFVHHSFEKFLEIINAAIKKYDPNHLNMGIRYGGSPSEDVIRMARVFDVYSFNTYKYEISSAYLDNINELTDLPILIGEFHFGTPGRGLAPGLSQVSSLKERGVAYSYYVENAFAHPSLVGTYWFLWRDQPNTGRNDGENYNIGIVDVTDQPYPDMVKALETTHKRLFDIHSGNNIPTEKQAEGKIKKKVIEQDAF